jgi:lysophospholipase L1-like esterase
MLLVFEGDSITKGDGSGNPYPSQVAGLLTADDISISWHNVAINSSNIANMIARASNLVEPYFHPEVVDVPQVLILFGGTNDLRDGESAATVISRTESYYNARKARGWKFVEVGMLPRTQVGLPADFETKRQAIRTDRLSKYTIPTAYAAVWQNADGNFYIDLGADITIGDDGDQNSTAYYQDKVHLTAAGCAIVAGYVDKALRLFP